MPDPFEEVEKGRAEPTTPNREAREGGLAPGTMPFTLRRVIVRSALLRVLGPRLLRTTATAAVIVFALGVFAGLVRLLPWLVSPNLPLVVAWPFAKVLLAAALEMAVVVGLPLGWALALATFVDRGEVRALEAVGTSPRTLVLATAPIALGLAAIGLVVVLLWGRDAARPGRLAADLLAAARAACIEAPPRAVDVPLLGASWLCFEDSPPVLYGGLGERVRTIPFTASEARVSEGLDILAFEDFRLVAKAAGSVSVQATSATIRGVSKSTRTTKLEARRRAVLLSATAAWLALVAGFCIVRAKVGGNVRAAMIGVVGPLVGVGTLSALERAGWTSLAYLLVPLAPSVAVFAVQAAQGCVPRRRVR